MQFTEEQAAEVKAWVVQRLEDISDADSDVLADYVLALIRTDGPDEEIKKATVENLEDFLKENTSTFVDEIFDRYNPKPESIPAPAPAEPAAAPSQPLPEAPAQPSSTSQIPSFGDDQRTSNQYSPSNLPDQPNNTSPGFSRKRGFDDTIPQQGNGHHNFADRPLKAPRGPRAQQGRGGFGGGFNVRGGRYQGLNPAASPFAPPPPHGQAPGLPAGFPTFDPNDPMGAMMALQSMGFPQLPGMPPMPGMPGTPGQPAAPGVPKIPQPCRDYETQGFCVLGSACAYQHGSDHVVANKDDEYDPTKATIVTDRAALMRGGGRGRGRGGRGRGRFDGPPRGRAEFSKIGPNEDRSITTIVVEQIPEEKFNEESVRAFFSEFGNIEEVTLKPQRRLALVKYDTYASARQAWESPKVIFDNRFVKVFWYRPPQEKEGTPKEEEKPQIDPAEVERQQAELQRIHEEKRKKREEMEKARAELEKQKAELAKRQAEERARLMERLKAKESKSDPATPAPNAGGDSATPAAGQPDENVSEQTKALRAQLAALEEEAKSLGLDPNKEDHGHGGYTGGFRGRGRGGWYSPSPRGAFRGRGGAPRGRGGVLRLDNRPKRVAVSGVEFTPEKDEALRFYLMGVGDYESIEPNPARSDSVIVSFKERYIAEQLYYGTSDIPNVGTVELSWVAGPSPAAAAGANATAGGQKDEAGDSVMEDYTAGSGQAQETGKETTHEVDYDVAEDDTWMS